MSTPMSRSKQRYWVHIPDHPEASGYVNSEATATRILLYYSNSSGAFYDLRARRIEPWCYEVVQSEYMGEKTVKVECIKTRPLQMTEKMEKYYYGPTFQSVPKKVTSS